MEIKPVADVLAAAGLEAPTLLALVPNAQQYQVLLMQPSGDIQVSPEGVRHRDRELAKRQFSSFLDDAHQTEADLVITPEYSMPWEVLIDALSAGRLPLKGKLWVLGCESIRIDELEGIKTRLAPRVTLIHEDVKQDQQKFIDPLVYIFTSPLVGDGDNFATVMLVQFKTQAMGGKNHFEADFLTPGTTIYQFGGVEGHEVTLVTLVCSDVLAFEDSHAKKSYDRAFVIHIQMNQKPRQEQFRKYRTRLHQYGGEATEILCLNWARHVQIWDGVSAQRWDNIAGSGWYLNSRQFDSSDKQVILNHRQGFYYTRLNSRVHALFFNYDPAVYLLRATKVYMHGVIGSAATLAGPSVINRRTWSDERNTWDIQPGASDGFDDEVIESGGAATQLTSIASVNPIHAERVLALCSGNIKGSEQWYLVDRLKSCSIDESEIIHRITFCQDPEENARRFRTQWLRRCANLWYILQAPENLPPSLSDLARGIELQWSRTAPHQNAYSLEGKGATVIYMGEESNRAEAQDVKDQAETWLHRSFADPNESHSAKQRLAVWYRDRGEHVCLGPSAYIKVDDPGDQSPVDIARP
jgi:hypothetical protein